MIKRILFLFTLVAFVLLVQGQTIPKWKMDDVVRSFSAKNDTTYVVNFWATFCKPCIEEIPAFISITNRYKSKKVKLLLVSLDLPSYVAVRLPAFIKKNNFKTNHVWLNETDADIFCPKIDAKWSGAIPATIIVNNKTGYKKFAEDQISPEDLEKYLNEAISGTAMNKYVAPMNDADVIKYPKGESVGENQFLVFKSNDSSVYSISAGKISVIARIEDMTVVIIENENVFYTYSNMGLTKLKTGDLVKANQFIGYATKNLDGEVAIELYKNDSKGNYITLVKEDFILRRDKRLLDHSIDNNDPQ
jgi:thiol-disulfide isomerase/thioredoxin